MRVSKRTVLQRRNEGGFESIGPHTAYLVSDASNSLTGGNIEIFLLSRYIHVI